MWYVASRYRDKEHSETPYKNLETMLRNDKREHFSVFRLMINQVWHIVLIGRKPKEPLLSQCMIELNKGVITQIPTDVYQALEARRLEKEDDARPLPGTRPGESKWTENHYPDRIGPYGQSLPLRESDLEAAKPVKGHITSAPSAFPGLTPGTPVTIRTIPFLRAYLDLNQITGEDILQYRSDLAGTSEDLAMSVARMINRINEERTRLADRYFFTPSAMALHAAVNHEKTQWIQPSNHLIIEIQKPFSTDYGEDVKGIILHYDFPYVEIKRLVSQKKEPTLYNMLRSTYTGYETHWSLEIINMRARTIFDATYDIASEKWIYLGAHVCPYNKCVFPGDPKNPLEACVPCNECKKATAYWAQWLCTAQRIVRRDYATDPESIPTDYPIHTQTYEQPTTKIVGHGKNARRIKEVVTRKIDFKLVKFDVSVREALREKVETNNEEKRGNWLTLHGMEARIYKKVHFSGVFRRYAGEHWRHIIERCINEGSFIEGGREYRLEIMADGHHAVISSIVDFDKWVPMLAPELRKTQIIKKVVASKFEKEK